MKFLKIALVILTVSIVGCREIKIEDGKIPAEYLEHVQAYLGQYEGKFNHHPAQVNVVLEGQKLVLSYQDQNGTDILGAGCSTVIGDLTSIRVRGKNNVKITEAVFDLDPNRCANRILGRSLVIGLKKKKDDTVRLGLSILERMDYEVDCRPDFPDHPRVPVPRLTTDCTARQVPVFLTGRVYK